MIVKLLTDNPHMRYIGKADELPEGVPFKVLAIRVMKNPLANAKPHERQA